MYINRCDNCGKEERISGREDEMIDEITSQYNNRIIVFEPDDILEKRRKYKSGMEESVAYDKEEEYYIMPRIKAFNFCSMECLIKFTESGKLKNIFNDWKEYTDKEEEERNLIK